MALKRKRGDSSQPTPKRRKVFQSAQSAKPCPTCISRGRTGTDHHRRSSSLCPFHEPSTRQKAANSLKVNDNEGVKYDTITRTVTFNIDKVLKVQELKDTIVFLAEQTSEIIKEVSEVLNAALSTLGLDEALDGIDEKFLSRLSYLLSITTRGKLSAISHPSSELEKSVFEAAEIYRTSKKGRGLTGCKIQSDMRLGNT